MGQGRPVRVAAALATAMLAFGVSGCDVVADRAVQEAEQAIEDATGIAVDTGGENTLPDGWPQDVPVYPDARIESSASVQSAEGTVHSARLITTEPFQAVIDWHDTEFEAKGWTVAQRLTTGTGDAATGAFTATKGTLECVVAVSVSQGEVTVDLQVLERP